MEGIIKLEKNKFDFKFKLYEGKYFCYLIDKNSEVVKYKITDDPDGKNLKEFGNTHIKENLIYVPQIEAYIDLDNI